MSGPTPSEPQTTPLAAPDTVCWYVRAASEEDIVDIAVAVGQLLDELGGIPPALPAMQATARSLLDGDAGLLLVAEAGGMLVGVLAVSWQTAIHAAGRYALIQDLWVHPGWRSRAIGAELLSALCELVSKRQIDRIEVGLPRESFAAVGATEAFYRANGFEPLGPRMRRLLE